MTQVDAPCVNKDDIEIMRSEIANLQKQLEEKNREAELLRQKQQSVPVTLNDGNIQLQYMPITISQETTLKSLVKNKVFRQYKYIDTRIWETGQIQKMIMNRIGLGSAVGHVEELYKRDIRKKVGLQLSQFRHTKVSALCAAYTRGKAAFVVYCNVFLCQNS